jgi:TIR domain/Pentapeptide repeats (8 copies)
MDIMANGEHLQILKQGASIWNMWRRNKPDVLPDLTGADLVSANLHGADLSGADLGRADLRRVDFGRANLSRAYFYRANLIEANLTEANLIEADLRRVDLSRADLSGADLGRADLRRTDFSKANLNDADLSHSLMWGTILGELDLRPVKGLATVRHAGPSHLSINTLYLSHGNIPEVFIQGTGAPDSMIDYIKSLVTCPIEYYTCFISYSSEDELFARRLHNDLQQEGVRCWFAPEDMDVGDKIKHRIDESIRLYDKLLLILSEHSIASFWVAYEVEKALHKEPYGVPNVLYPVRLDRAILTCTTDWARDIKETRHIGDFEQWIDPEKYHVSFQRLLRALRGKTEKRDIDASM